MTRFFEAPVPRIIAHRGFAHGAPENTLLAFARALETGADVIETDVHASQDGVAIVAHDPTVLTESATRIDIARTRSTELARLDLGNDQHPPTLRDTLLAFPDTRFNIDVKSDDAVAPTVNAIVGTGAEDRVLVTSFAERRRAALVDRIPGVATSASQQIVMRVLAARRLPGGALLRSALKGVGALQVPRRAKGLTIVDRTLVDLLSSHGVEVHVWTINDAKAMRELLELGVHGIVTDRTDVAAEVVPAFRDARGR